MLMKVLYLRFFIRFLQLFELVQKGLLIKRSWTLKYVHPSFSQVTHFEVSWNSWWGHGSCDQANKTLLHYFSLKTSTVRLITSEKVIGTSTCLTFYYLSYLLRGDCRMNAFLSHRSPPPVTVVKPSEFRQWGGLVGEVGISVMFPLSFGIAASNLQKWGQLHSRCASMSAWAEIYSSETWFVELKSSGSWFLKLFFAKLYHSIS